MILAAALLAALLLTACGSGSRVRLGAAASGGVYYEFAQALAALDGTPDLEVRETAGSAANLRLLSGGYLQAAVAQSDMARDAYHHTGAFSSGDVTGSFSLAAVLYDEECHVIVRADSGIADIEELQGRTVSIGEEESGTEQNAEQILAAYGLDEKLVTLVNRSYHEAAEQLRSGEIDAMFCTSGVQTAVIEELAADCGIALLPVDGSGASRLLAAYPSYSVCTIPAGTYTGQASDVQTVGVRALLLVSNELSDETVETLTAVLLDGADELEAALPVRLAGLQAAAGDTGIPYHPGAAACYWARGIDVSAQEGE